MMLAGLPLIETKLLRPQIREGLVPRLNLFRRLDRGLDRKLTLVSAPAGYGKSTLLSAWLERNPAPSAWLSLDEHDSDLRIFVAYLIAAIRLPFPNACPDTQELLSAPHLPALDHLTTSLVNEIARLQTSFILVLDDYHSVSGEVVHQLLSALLQYQPRQMHLAIATRRDPPFSIAALRASQQMAEIRMDDLRFAGSEIETYLETCLGRQVSPETVTVLAKRTEGWVVGLRLACLALRHQADEAAFIGAFEGTHRYIMEYLMDEVLSGQPEPVQEFLVRTAILDRFCAPLCDAILAVNTARDTVPWEPPPAENILAQLERSNLFLVPLDQKGQWFRYHQLLQELLRHRLSVRSSARDVAALHTTAANWLAGHGYSSEALDHYLAAGDIPSASALVGRLRYSLMNIAQWQLLDHLLNRFPQEAVASTPDLLMLKTWLQYHRGNYSVLPKMLQQLNQTMTRFAKEDAESDHLEGEIQALQSLVAYLMVDPQRAIAAAQRSIETTRHELWIVRVLARLCLAGAMQMVGDLQAAYRAIYGGFAEEDVDSDTFKATLLMAACNIYWIAADLHGLQQTAQKGRELSQSAGATQMWGWAQYNLGCVAYHQNDMEEAERLFAAVARQPYMNYHECYAHSVCGLALAYQVQSRHDEASTVADAAVKFMLSTGNTLLLPVVEALQAELALRQGRIAIAEQWASRFKTTPPITPAFRLYYPHLTLVKTWLAHDSTASRLRADELLGQLAGFFEATHNSCFLIETLALQALLLEAKGLHEAALKDLDRALSLAEPGGFIRLFVDLGPNMARLLSELAQITDSRKSYIRQILAAFARSSGHAHEVDGQAPIITSEAQTAQGLAEPLTAREMDVLSLLVEGLSDQEIALRLVITTHTVRTHLKHLFAKLEVHNRREAVARAGKLAILSRD